MKKVVGVIVVVFSIMIIPLIYLVGELYDIFWLRISAAIIVVPFTLWWGYYGYNIVFGKNNTKKEESLDVEEKLDSKKNTRKADKFYEIKKESNEDI